MDLRQQLPTAKALQGEMGPFVARVAAPAPATASADLFVTIGAFDGGRHEHGPCLWEPPAGALPAVGELCVVVRAIEEDGEGEQNIVIAFDRNDSAATDAEITALDTRVDSLEGQSKIPFPFASGWANSAVAGVEPATYSKHGRLVRLQGSVTKTGGAPANGDVIGTLPDGFRPTGALVLPICTGGTSNGTVRVEADGDVVWRSGDAIETDFTSLSGITFVID